MAANNYIMVSGNTTRLNFQIRTFVDQLKNSIELGNAIKATLAKASLDGSAILAAQTGLSEENAAQAATLISNGMYEINQSTTMLEIFSRLG